MYLTYEPVKVSADGTLQRERSSVAEPFKRRGCWLWRLIGDSRRRFCPVAACRVDRHGRRNLDLAEDTEAVQADDIGDE